MNKGYNLDDAVFVTNQYFRASVTPLNLLAATVPEERTLRTGRQNRPPDTSKCGVN